MPNSFISFTAGTGGNAGDASDLKFVQILATQPKVTVVETCNLKDEARPILSIASQEFSPMVPVADEAAAIIARQSIDVF